MLLVQPDQRGLQALPDLLGPLGCRALWGCPVLRELLVHLVLVDQVGRVGHLVALALLARQVLPAQLAHLGFPVSWGFRGHKE